MALRKKMRRILVIKNRAIGDTILLTGVLRVLRQHQPDHLIDVLVRSPAGELLEGLPYVNRIISAKEPKDKIERVAYWMRLVRRLRERRYEYVLNFHASMRTALTAKLLRADTRVANHHELKGRNWFSDILVPGRGQLKATIDRDLDVLRAIGIQATLEEAMPEIVLTPAETKLAAELIDSKSVPGRGPRIFLGIGGSRETKRWPAVHFISIMRKMVDEHDARFVMSTIDSDRPWMNSFLKLLCEDKELSARLLHFESQSLRQTALIMSRCQIYVGNDSGLKHLAVALGLKTFTFFGPEHPLEWHPYDTKWHPYAFLDGLRCRTEQGTHWCPVPVCNKHEHKCMQDISPVQVQDEINRITRE